MTHDFIHVEHARVHNLKDVSLDIPRDKIVVFVGVSGSGKSSLVFDTLHTEAQRQLIETFSSFARRRLPKLNRPDVDDIRNLSTSIVIDQKRLGRTLRSTVGTATEVYTYLRLLCSRCGDLAGVPSFLFGFNNPDGMCPACKGLGKRIRMNADDAHRARHSPCAKAPSTHPTGRWAPGTGASSWPSTCSTLDKPLREFSEEEMDRLLYGRGDPDRRSRTAAASTRSRGRASPSRLEDTTSDGGDDECPSGKRDAYDSATSSTPSATCAAACASTSARASVHGRRHSASATRCRWSSPTSTRGSRTVDGPVAEPLVHKMRGILGHLIEIGVGYLSLNRAVSTLSGGESQRVKMARQLDCDLSG